MPPTLDLHFMTMMCDVIHSISPPEQVSLLLLLLLSKRLYHVLLIACKQQHKQNDGVAMTE